MIFPFRGAEEIDKIKNDFRSPDPEVELVNRQFDGTSLSLVEYR